MRLGVGAVLLLLLAGTPVTAPPRLLNLAALLDFANVAYQAYQRAIERLAQATVEWQGWAGKWAARGHPGSCSRTGCPA